ncbi:unnamed protein product [Hydatigera taeniaeformis]|uniref:proline--tRNA ligase n=1 Tax=Hydatigena taeniaeformis TaxID=6205 RepID=A0A158REI1_HYDTA|nr:unnamed protein product [Hydatigera taeniaeformis]
MHRFTFFSKLLRQGTFTASSKEEGLASHKLLLHGGILSVSSPGTFVLSPIALRVVDKLTAFIDYKMSEVGGQKCLFPTLGRSQLWAQSGRWEKFGADMFRLNDRTHEEEACEFVHSFDLGSSVLPLRIYQISAKFRDEIKPKLGLLRCREFLMKDMYSFDVDAEAAKETYDTLSNTYLEIFHTLRLPIFKVTAEGGLMGDCPSHEFHCLLPVGEDTLSVCPSCKKAVLAANSGIATSGVLQDSRVCPDCGLSCQVSKVLQMGCYGIGITRLLATALEYFTTTSTEGNPPTELRWPSGFAPYSGAIALQKDNAKDALSTDELNVVLARFRDFPSPSTSLTPGSTFFAGLLPRGDILVDDRPRLSLGRKLLDLRRLGVPWILVAKSLQSSPSPEYELVDVNRGGISFAASLDDAATAFTCSDFEVPLLSVSDGQRKKLWHGSGVSR